MRQLIFAPFTFCQYFLLALGRCFKLSYVQISVIFNLYLQGGVLLLSALLPLVVSGWSFAHNLSWAKGVLLVLFALYFCIYLAAFIWMLRHYHLPMEYAFDLCVNDLQHLAHKWNMSYQAVNLIIFICCWLILVAFHIFLAFAINI